MDHQEEELTDSTKGHPASCHGNGRPDQPDDTDNFESGAYEVSNTPLKAEELDESKPSSKPDIVSNGLHENTMEEKPPEEDEGSEIEVIDKDTNLEVLSADSDNGGLPDQFTASNQNVAHSLEQAAGYSGDEQLPELLSDKESDNYSETADGVDRESDGLSFTEERPSFEAPLANPILPLENGGSKLGGASVDDEESSSADELVSCSSASSEMSSSDGERLEPAVQRDLAAPESVLRSQDTNSEMQDPSMMDSENDDHAAIKDNHLNPDLIESCRPQDICSETEDPSVKSRSDDRAVSQDNDRNPDLESLTSQDINSETTDPSMVDSKNDSCDVIKDNHLNPDLKVGDPAVKTAGESSEPELEEKEVSLSSTSTRTSSEAKPEEEFEETERNGQGLGTPESLERGSLSALGVKGKQLPGIPLFYKPEIFMHGQQPILVLQPVMGSLPKSLSVDGSKESTPSAENSALKGILPIVLPLSSPSIDTATRESIFRQLMLGNTTPGTETSNSKEDDDSRVLDQKVPVSNSRNVDAFCSKDDTPLVKSMVATDHPARNTTVTLVAESSDSEAEDRSTVPVSLDYKFPTVSSYISVDADLLKEDPPVVKYMGARDSPVNQDEPSPAVEVPPQSPVELVEDLPEWIPTSELEKAFSAAEQETSLALDHHITFPTTTLPSTNPFAQDLAEQGWGGGESGAARNHDLNPEDTAQYLFGPSSSANLPNLSPGARPKEIKPTAEPINTANPFSYGTNPFAPDVSPKKRGRRQEQEPEHATEVVVAADVHAEANREPYMTHRRQISNTSMVTLFETTCADTITPLTLPQAPVPTTTNSPGNGKAQQRDEDVGAVVSKPEAVTTSHTLPVPGVVAPHWVPDVLCTKCVRCQAKFTVVRRKHHCRGCGKIFCHSCCSQLARLPYMEYQVGRVCLSCTELIKQAIRNKKKQNPLPTSGDPSKSSESQTRQLPPAAAVQEEAQGSAASVGNSTTQQHPPKSQTPTRQLSNPVVQTQQLPNQVSQPQRVPNSSLQHQQIPNRVPQPQQAQNTYVGPQQVQKPSAQAQQLSNQPSRHPRSQNPSVQYQQLPNRLPQPQQVQSPSVGLQRVQTPSAQVQQLPNQPLQPNRAQNQSVQYQLIPNRLIQPQQVQNPAVGMQQVQKPSAQAQQLSNQPQQALNQPQQLLKPASVQYQWVPNPSVQAAVPSNQFQQGPQPLNAPASQGNQFMWVPAAPMQQNVPVVYMNPATPSFQGGQMFLTYPQARQVVPQQAPVILVQPQPATNQDFVQTTRQVSRTMPSSTQNEGPPASPRRTPSETVTTFSVLPQDVGQSAVDNAQRRASGGVPQPSVVDNHNSVRMSTRISPPRKATVDAVQQDNRQSTVVRGQGQQVEGVRQPSATYNQNSVPMTSRIASQRVENVGAVQQDIGQSTVERKQGQEGQHGGGVIRPSATNNQNTVPMPTRIAPKRVENVVAAQQDIGQSTVERAQGQEGQQGGGVEQLSATYNQNSVPMPTRSLPQQLTVFGDMQQDIGESAGEKVEDNGRVMQSPATHHSSMSSPGVSSSTSRTPALPPFTPLTPSNVKVADLPSKSSVQPVPEPAVTSAASSQGTGVSRSQEEERPARRPSGDSEGSFLFADDSDPSGKDLRTPLKRAGRTISWRYRTQGKSKLQERKKALAKDLKDLPNGVTVQASPNFFVHVKRIKLKETQREPVNLWCFQSEGLNRLEHLEVVLLLEVKRREEVFPEEVLRIYRAILHLAKLGNRFEHCTYLSSNNEFLGNGDEAALLFVSSEVKPKPVGLKETPSPFLYGILVKRSELSAAMFTPSRLLLCLGHAMNCFPFPLWNSRDRKPIQFESQREDRFFHTVFAMNKYLKNSVPEAMIAGLYVVKESNKVVLQVPYSGQSTIISLLDRLIVKENQTATVPLLGDMPGYVDHCKVVVCGELGKSVVAFGNPTLNQKPAQASVVGLGFLLLHLGVDASSPLSYGGELLDDGALIFFSKTHTQKLRQSLDSKTNCYFYLGDNFDIAHFELRWTQDVRYHEMPQAQKPTSQVTTPMTLSRASTAPTETGSDYHPGHATVNIQHSGYRNEVDLLKKVFDEPSSVLRALEGNIREACTNPLMKHANKMSSGDRQEMQLRVVLRPSYKKWSVGPSDLPTALIRSLQMALGTVKMPKVFSGQLVMNFDVTVLKQ